jgi:DNA-binding MarR family transcriptional regulator
MNALSATAAQGREDRAAIVTVLRILDEFRSLRPDLPISRAYTLLCVALEEGRPVNEYAKDQEVPKTTMTRHLLDLGDQTRRREPGMGLLIQRMSPLDRRIHETFLTPSGRALVHRVLRIFKQGK